MECFFRQTEVKKLSPLLVMGKSENESWFSVYFSIANFILGCRWFRKTKNLSASDSLLKRQMISSPYLRYNITSHFSNDCNHFCS